MSVDPAEAVHVTNELGMVDVAVRPHSSDALSVLVVGANNIDAAAVPIGAQLTRRLEHLLTDMLKREAQVTKLAHPNTDSAQHARWIDEGLADFESHVIVLAVPATPSGADLESVRGVLRTLVDRVRFAVLLLEGSTDADTQPWRELALQHGTAVVNPAAIIEVERAELGLADTASWGPNEHRVVAVQLARVIARGVTTATENAVDEHERHEGLLSSPDAALRRPAEPVLWAPQHPTESEPRFELGLADWPTPFTSATAWAVSDVAPTREAIEQEQRVLTGEWGLDHGSGLPLTDHHQRYSRGRRGRSTSSAAWMTHDARRDNAPLEGHASWLAQVLAWSHSGNVDHLAGISAWGARALPLGVTQRVNGHTRLTTPAGTEQSAQVPFAFNADQFPLGTLAVETLGGIAPDHVDVSGGLCPSTDTVQGNDQRVPPVERLRLAATHLLPGGTTLLLYRPESVGEPIAPNRSDTPVSQRTTLHHSSLDGFELALPALQVLGATLHNLDPDAIAASLRLLTSEFGVRFPLINAQRDHTFYTGDGLATANARLERVRKRQPDGAALADFGDPPRPASTTMADAPTSPTYLMDALRDSGLRFLSANGGLDELRDHDDVPYQWPAQHPGELIGLGADRAGAPVAYIERFDPPDPERAPVVAADHFGWHSPDDTSSETDRRWMTRPSVLAGYAEAHAHTHRNAGRDGDAISVPATSGPLAIDHPTQLFGLSFRVDDIGAASVHLGDRPVESLIRWPRRDAVTVGECGIRWPILSDLDPTAVAHLGGDLRSCELKGQWAWSADEAMGQLSPDATGTAQLRLDLGRLHPAGAQIISIRLRGRENLGSFALQLSLDGGARIEVGEAAPQSTDSAVGWWPLPKPSAGWEQVTIPLWGLQWSHPPGPGMTVNGVDIVCEGMQAAGIEMADLWLGRARPLSSAQQPPPLLGGNALGRTTITGLHLGSGATFASEVADDGLWCSGPVAQGAWAVSADDGEPTGVQLISPRFDIDLAPTGPTRT